MRDFMHTPFGFYRGQSYLAKLVMAQNCTKCLEILLLLYDLHIFASEQIKAENNDFFEQLFDKFRATF